MLEDDISSKDDTNCPCTTKYNEIQMNEANLLTKTMIIEVLSVLILGDLSCSSNSPRLWLASMARSPTLSKG
jgi:hypothetical protein